MRRNDFTSNLNIYKICKLIVNQGYGPKGVSYHDHVEKDLITDCQVFKQLGISQFKKLNFF